VVSVKVGYRWHLRTVMAQRGMFQTTELVPLLAERGVRLSREQVYRLVTKTPQRLNLEVLAALCDILEVTPAELLEPYRTSRKTRRESDRAARPTPRRARIVADRDR
jgi:DNA-binding Xre family transcriptional regulator